MQVYYLPITSPLWGEMDSQLLQYVSKDRQEKVFKYVNIPDRKLSLYAALVARMGLSRITGIPAKELRFQCKTNHKPQLLSASDFDFSYSHTRDAVLCCISSDGSVGADIEKLKASPFEIMDRVFHPEEIRYVQCASVGQQSLRFFEVWTRKEAYTKQLGTGLVYDLSACNTLSPAISSILHTWQQDDYLCCVCGSNPASIKINRISERDIWNYFGENILSSS